MYMQEDAGKLPSGFAPQRYISGENGQERPEEIQDVA